MAKISELEGVRGIAALLVVFHHSMLGFTPRLHGMFDSSHYSLFGTPAFFLINGSAAVVIFFVLSGFVLTRKAMSSGSIEMLAATALRRWPRLALPVLISNVAVALVFLAFGLRNREAAELAKSTWLAWFYVEPSSNADIWAAAYEGLWLTFVRGNAYYNSSLWTMFYEFFGSFIALVVAAISIIVPLKLRPWILVIAWIIATYISPYLGCFIAGVALAVFHINNTFVLSRWLWLLLLAIAALFSSYSEAASISLMGFFKFMGPVAAFNPVLVRIALHSLAAAIIIAAALNWTSAQTFLRSSFAQILGKYSFSIYLVHVPVVCSLGSYTYILIFHFDRHLASIAAILTSVLFSFLIAWPLMNIDRWWTGALRRIEFPSRFPKPDVVKPSR